MADLSASLDFGTTGCEKRDLVVAAAAAVGHLTRGGGNRIGAVVATGATADPDPGPRRPAAPAAPAARRWPPTPRSGPGERGDLSRRAGAAAPAAAPPRAGRRASPTSSARSTGNGRCARCPAGTTCWPSRCSTRATWSCRPSAWSPCSTRKPVAPRRSRPPPELRSAFADGRGRAPRAGRRRAAPGRRRAAGAAHRPATGWPTCMRFVMSRKRGWTGAAAGAHRAADAAGRGGLVNFAQPFWLAARRRRARARRSAT